MRKKNLVAKTMERDIQSVVDQDQRDRALDPCASLIVQAPAGSGKTELLIQRYLRLLATVEHPESVVAITFTKKAAGEMRSRVLEALRQAATEPPPARPHAARTWELACAVLERDRNSGWQIADNPARLRIQTIDALCYSISRQMPWLSRFGAPAEITEDAGELYSEAARETLAMLNGNDERADAIERLLRHLDNNLATLESLLAAMLAKRDQWLRHIVPAGQVPRATLREMLESALQNLIREALQRMRKCLPRDSEQEIVDMARHAAIQLNGSNPQIAPCVNLFELPGAEPEDLLQWQGIAELLLTRNGDVRKKPDKRLGFSRQTPEKQRLLSLLGRIEGNPEPFCSYLRAVRCLPAPAYSEPQWQVLDALCTILPMAAAQLKTVFGRQGLADFAEVAGGALFALGDSDNPTDLALTLDYRIQHLLVDEFQDTSILQFSLLERLTAGWEPGDGRTLFLVGDPMQSIYRFREAEVGLFLRAREYGIGPIQLESLQLSVNFRSGGGIVKWVNENFADVLPRVEDMDTGAVPYAESIPYVESCHELPVAIHPFLADDREAEAAEVVSIIESARSQDPRGKIAILVRARTHLPAIAHALRCAGLRFRAVEIDPLGERQIIRDLLALTRALLHAADRPSWLAVLRAPWCGTSLADLLALTHDRRDATIWDLVCDERRCASLSSDGRQRLSRLREVLGIVLPERGRGSLRRWVEGAWLGLGGPACVESVTDLEDASIFLDLLDKLKTGGDLYDFEALEEQVDSLFARPDVLADDTLQVMTIHKAKGLEFDTVIVPGLGRKPPHDDPRLLFWLDRPGTEELLLAPIKEAGTDEDTTYQYLKSVDERKRSYENGRLLYVAVTRAKRSLHLLGHTTVDLKKGELRRPIAGSLLELLWPKVHVQFFAKIAAGIPSVGESEAGMLSQRIRRLPADWELPEAPPAVMGVMESRIQVESQDQPTYLWVGDTQRHVGTVVHRMLLRIARDGLAQWAEAAVIEQRPTFRAILRGLGVPPAELDDAAARVESALLRALGDPRGRWVLAPHADAQSEYALTGVIEGKILQVQIDRTFVDEYGVRWIIDYKTGTHEGSDREAFLDNERERYRGQLERYAAILGALERRPIRMALYFPLMGGWREYESASRGRLGG